MDRSRNWALNQVIDNYLDNEEWFVREVKMGIKEAGNPDSLVSNDAVKQQLEKRLADLLDKNSVNNLDSIDEFFNQDNPIAAAEVLLHIYESVQ